MAEKALSGLKIIDLTRVLGGPYCTMILADHGATVIKVEPPQGDETRDWGPPFLDRAEGVRDASYFLGVNRNKAAISLDLARPEGRAVLLRLLDDADVLVENFKPGSMEAWGIGYDALSARFPRLIHCRVSGFGADGPLGGLPGYDAVVQAMTGLMTINGNEGSGPLRMGTPLVDMGTGLYSAVAILMALHERTRSGQGQYIDMTLHDVGLTLLHSASANYLLSGKRPGRHGNAHPNIAPYDIFETATGPIFIAGGNDGQFRKLLTRLGREDLVGDGRFATNADRVANRAALNALLAEALAERDGGELALELIRAGVPAGPVQSIDEALESPHAEYRGMVVAHDGVRMVGTPIKFSRTPGGVESAPPRFGQDTRAVLEAHGFDPDEIAALAAAGVIRNARR
jgi:crotonobetainyl-CoA:carnitine CoA-transferase CaiB-like acyl-CoA transferase